MYSAYKLNKQGDNIQPWCTPFPIWNQSVVPCPVLTIASWPAYRFLKRQVRWSGIPISFRIFQFINKQFSNKLWKLPMAKIYLLVAWVMLCSIPACPLDNKEIFIHLRQMKTIPSQSCLEHRHDFKFPWRRENISSIQMTQGTSYHQWILQQISDSSPRRAAVLVGTAASWTNYSPAWIRAWNSWKKWLWIVPIWELLSGSISKVSISTWRERNTAPVPGRLLEWKLKSAFPSCKNPQEKSTDKMKIILVTLSTQSDCCLLKTPKWSSVCLQGEKWLKWKSQFYKNI